MKDIPSEIILQILHQVKDNSEQDLVTCLYVCKLWSYLAVDLVWNRPVMRSTDFFAVLQQQQYFYPYHAYIRRISLTPLSSTIVDKHLVAMQDCVRLERLTLAGCSLVTNVGLCGLISALTVGAQLVSIDLSNVHQVSDITILNIAASCPLLQGLNLSMNQEQLLITNRGMVEVANHCRDLKRIKLNNCINISEESAVALAINCPHLVEVDLMNCTLSDASLLSIFCNCQELRELRLSQNEVLDVKLSDSAFDSLVHYEQLRLVDFTAITTITDYAIQVLIHAAPKIRSLVLNKCYQITDQGVLAICKLGRFLHYLHLGHCIKLTDRSITQLAEHCTRIRYLDMACCTELTDKSVIELANLSKLKRIGLVKCHNITDIAILAITSHVRIATCLERIHLSYCTQLSVRAISRLLNTCHKLNHLSLTNVPAFIRQDLKNFCREPPKEFTELQRRPFCVYSGQGVQDLAAYLDTMYEQQKIDPSLLD